MHSEENTHKQNGGTGPARRVRSLLGLPDKSAGSLQGHGPLPPGAFRYQMQSGFGEPLLHSPFPQLPTDQPDGQEKTPDGINRGTESPPTMTADASPQDARQAPHQATDNVRNMPQSLTPGESPQAVHEARAMRHTAQGGEKLRTGPVAVNTHRPSGTATARQDRARPQAQIMPDSTQIMAEADRAEALRQTRAGGEQNTGHGNRQEIAIPGRSTVRQVFSALLAATEGENAQAADRQPTMTQQSSPLSAGQARPESAAVDPGEGSAPLPRRPVAGLSAADRQTHGTSGSLPAAAQAQGLTPQESTTANMTAAKATTSATVQAGKLSRNTMDKITERPGKTEIPTAASGMKPAPPPLPQQEHPPAQAKPRTREIQPSVTPARRPDEDGARKIEELRRTFYELVSKKTTVTEVKANEQPTTAEAETPPQPPLQQIVVINRTTDSRSTGRVPAAFWERSCMARTTLKMIR